MSIKWTSSYQAKFIIERNRMYVENANRAVQAAQLTPDTIEPNPKNPIIASFFRNIGYADQLGSGVRNLFKYSRIYSGEEPVFDEGDVFRIIVPLDEELEGENDKSFIQATQSTQSATQSATRFTQSTTQSTQAEELVNISALIRGAIIECATISQKEIAEKTGLNINTIKYHVRKMQKEGALERVGTPRNGYWVVK